MKVALLTCRNLDEYITYENHLDDALNAKDIKFEWIEWEDYQKVDWNSFDCAVIRTTWDYQKNYQEFIKALEHISSKTKLFNPLEIVKWNSSKDYLLEFNQTETKPVPIIEINISNETDILELFNKLECETIVIKPFISAGSYLTYKVDMNNYLQLSDDIISACKEKKMMAQPYMESIANEGEFSLHFFDKQFSHAILKKPKAGDFRSQEEFDSDIKSITPEPAAMSFAQKVLDHIKEDLLYARVDFVRKKDDQFYLMELELIEPSLYFSYDKDSATRLVEKMIQKF